MTTLLAPTAVHLLQSGGLVIFPTETVYGLGCLATDGAAVERLFALKGRSAGQPPPVIIAGPEQLWALVDHLPDVADRLAARYWPGGLTLVLHARPDLPGLLLGQTTDGRPTVGVRWTGHPLAAMLCREIGMPMVATSANFSGATGPAATPDTLAAIAPELKARVDVVLDGGQVAGQPSTVVDCTCSPPRLLRQGRLQLPPEIEDW